MSSKIYAGAEDGPSNTTVIASIGPSRLKLRTRHRTDLCHRIRRRLYNHGPRRLERAYKRLSPTTRETIRRGVSLYALLYIFFTVPFRMAFYYDPSRITDLLHQRQWTIALSVYAVMDAIVDIIGLFEFLRFYRRKRGSLRRFSSFTLRKTASRKTSPVHPTKLSGSPSKRLQHGESKWTIAAIERTALAGGIAALSRNEFGRKQSFKFVLEIVSLLPVEIIPCGTGDYNALHLVRATKICRLYRLQRSIERIIDIYSDRVWVQLLSSVGIKTLVRNIVMCLGFCHYVACGYMIIAHVECGISFEACEKSVETSWAIRDRLSGATVARKYARTLYWASRTILLLGFDDVAPVSDADTIYVIIVTVFGALFVSSLLASFLFICRFWNARDAAFVTHVDNAREYMRSQNIPRAIRRQVIEYFTYSWKTHQSLDSEEALHLMPKHLELKVVSTLKANRIKKVCFLAKETVEFINLLAAALIRRVYSPTDLIIEPKLNAQMFFVIRGRVVLSAFNGTNSKECQTGDFFAEICLLSPEKFDEKAVAKTFCELYVLTKVKFDEAIVDFYRETEADVRNQMAEILDKYLTQQCKMTKLLGMQGKLGSGRHLQGLIGEQATSTISKRHINWKLPGSVFRAYWDVVRLLAIMYVAFEVPYYSVFISSAQDQHMLVDQQTFGFRYALTLLTELVFGVNIVLRSRFLAHLDPIVMIAVKDPKLIFEAYKANGFYFDLVAWLPVGITLETLATASNQNYPVFFRILRLLRLREIPNLLADVCEYYSVSSKTHLVISLLLGISFLLHIVGCVWFEMAWIPHGGYDHSNNVGLRNATRPECLEMATLFSNCSWVTFDCYAHIGTEFPAEDPDSTYQASFAYLRSMYWAIVTLTTVGYGDITAYSTGESYFAAFWIFVGGIINFATVGAMSSTISNAVAPHRRHIEKLNTLSSSLERVGISELLSAEIRRFYHLEFTGRKQAYESQLLSNLPDQLCYELSSLLHSEAVKRVELFDSASIEFLREVTGKFRHRSYQNGDTICFEGDICREFLVLLRGSKVNVFFRSRKVPVRALHEGDCYGANEFLLKCTHHATLIAASLVHASVMTREQFDSIQRKFDDDLRDMKEEAQTLLTDQHKSMRRIVQNLVKLKLQPHLMATSTLFYHGDLAITSYTNKGRGKNRISRDVYATRDMLTALWKAIITFWNVYNAIFVIFRVCFQPHLNFSRSTSIAVWIADLSCDACYAVDIYLRLYYFGNAEVGIENLLERKEIDKQYLRSSTFKWDVVASLPIYTPFASGSLIASLCRFPKLIRCVDLWTYLDEIIVQAQQRLASHNVSAYLSPVKLMIILMLVAHYVGCVFYRISEHECEHVERCWINSDKVLDKHHYALSILYARAFYWAITTLLLAGSRETVPRNTASTLWAGFTCLCCTFIIGHIVGEISDLFQELSRETKQYKSRLANFDSFAKEHELPEILVKRVGYFFREQLKHAKGEDLHDTVHDLSANLRLKLMIEVYGSAISLLPIGRYLTSSQINNLTLRLKSELFIPGDNVIVEGTYGSRLCTLRKGLAAVFWTSSVTTIAVLMEGAVFGEVSFFLSGQQRLATVRATTSCEVLYVTKYDWEELWASNGDISDAQVQRHAQHAILEWVQHRLQRYQRLSLHIANKTMRILAAHRQMQATAAAVAGTDKAKRRLSVMLLSYRQSNPSVFGSSSVLAEVNPTPAVAVETKISIAGTEVYLLEKKAAYLQAKTGKCIKKFYPAILALRANRRSSSAISNRSLRSSISRRSTSSGLSGFYRSLIGDSNTPIMQSSTSSIQVLEFMIDINPINKTVRSSLTDEHLHHVEGECWARFKLLVTAEYRIGKLLKANAPPDISFLRTPVSGSATAQEPSLVNIRAARNKFVRPRSLRYDEHANRKQHLQHFVPRGNRKSSAPATPNLSSIPHGGLKNRRFSVVAAKLNADHTPKNGNSAAESKCIVGRKHKRSNSLPHFGYKFFEEMRRNETKHSNAQAGLDFEILQRCQHLRDPKQIEFSNWYRPWKYHNDPATRPEHESAISESMHTHHFSNRLSSPAKYVVGNFTRQPGLLVIKPWFKSKSYKKVAQHWGTSWDALMFLVALYHLLLTTFKVCFSADLSFLPAKFLRSWSQFDILLDVLCVFDVAGRLRHKFFSNQTNVATDNSKSKSRRELVAEPTLYTDIIALLPFELLLLAPDVRVPVEYMTSVSGAADASWWTTRWLLRVNRLLLIRRVEPLFDKLMQLVADNEAVRANEALLSFLRGLATYLTMGHLLACMWVVSSRLDHIYIASETSEVTHAARVLIESSSTSSGAEISLVNMYLQSLLFAMECISTLFYGDILAMNPVEAVTELGITFWSLYIYGALVGAQGELFDARARREASFEQILGQLQHYLVQNEVPKEIKHQVKAYYARLWRRRKGEAEFKAVEHVSRALYEDVVLTTIRSFAVQVKAFEALDDQFLRALLVCLQYVVCSENEEVFVIGDMDRSMYFIAEGRVSVKMGSSESIRDRGEFFGELALLYGMSRLETCSAVTVAELYRLDHEPYERLLLEFPEYRARNKLAWTTLLPGKTQDHSHAVDALRRKFRPLKSNGPPVSSGIASLMKMAVNVERIEAQLPHSYIYRSTMELLSRLSKVDPLEAKDLFIKSRDGARRQLKKRLGIATSRPELGEDEVRSFRSRSPSLTSPEDGFQHHSDSVEPMEALVEELPQLSENVGSTRPRLSKRSSATLLRSQDASVAPQLRRWSSSTARGQQRSVFEDPVQSPTAINE